MNYTKCDDYIYYLRIIPKWPRGHLNAVRHNNKSRVISGMFNTFNHTARILDDKMYR